MTTFGNRLKLKNEPGLFAKKEERPPIERVTPDHWNHDQNNSHSIVKQSSSDCFDWWSVDYSYWHLCHSNVDPVVLKDPVTLCELPLRFPTQVIVSNFDGVIAVVSAVRCNVEITELKTDPITSRCSNEEVTLHIVCIQIGIVRWCDWSCWIRWHQIDHLRTTYSSIESLFIHLSLSALLWLACRRFRSDRSPVIFASASICPCEPSWSHVPVVMLKSSMTRCW